MRWLVAALNPGLSGVRIWGLSTGVSTSQLAWPVGSEGKTFLQRLSWDHLKWSRKWEIGQKRKKKIPSFPASPVTETSEEVCEKYDPVHVSLTRSPWLLLAPLLSPAVPQVTSPPCCLCPEGVHRFQWIRNLVPEFGVSSSHVRVLSSPTEFFELMKVSRI